MGRDVERVSNWVGRCSELAATFAKQPFTNSNHVSQCRILVQNIRLAARKIKLRDSVEDSVISKACNYLCSSTQPLALGT